MYVLSSLAVGLALASAPGPVQAVLFDEAVRGGVRRGLKAMAGASLTFGLMLVTVALGLSLFVPRGAAFRVLQVAGGVFLMWAALDGLRSARLPTEEAAARPALPPLVRGALAVLLNPGAWLFLGTAASSLLAGAAREGGRVGALAAALALMAGAAGGDSVLVVFGGTGLRRGSRALRGWVQRALALVLAVLGASVMVAGLRGAAG